jgi:hypothetical protein
VPYVLFFVQWKIPTLQKSQLKECHFDGDCATVLWFQVMRWSGTLLPWAKARPFGRLEIVLEEHGMDHTMVSKEIILSLRIQLL